jgi:hypothetical protein
MPKTQIPLKPQKVWWRVIVGSLLLFTTIENVVNPAPNLLKACSPNEQLGMDGMAVIMAVVAI